MNMEKLKSLAKAALYSLLFLAVQFAVVIIFMIIAVIKTISGGELDPAKLAQAVSDYTLDHTMLLSLIYGIVAIALAALIFVIRKKNFFYETGIRKTNPVFIPLSLLLGCSLYVVACVLLTYAPFPESWVDAYEDSSSILAEDMGILAFISTAIIAPIAEEIYFRGLVYTRLAKGFGIYVGAAIASLVFGLMHGTVIWVIYASLLGLMLAFVFTKTRSLICSICTHMAFNAMNYIVEDIDIILILLGFAMAAGAITAIVLLSKRKAKAL